MVFMIAVDIDGILATYNKIERKKNKFNLHEYYKTLKPIERGVLFSKHVKPIIISSRKFRFEAVTEKWLKSNGFDFSFLYLMPNNIPKNKENIISFKSSIINSLQIRFYYEDDITLINKMKLLCPNTSFIHIKNNNWNNVKEYKGDLIAKTN